MTGHPTLTSGGRGGRPGQARPSHPIPSHLIPSHPIPSHPIPSHPVKDSEHEALRRAWRDESGQREDVYLPESEEDGTSQHQESGKAFDTFQATLTDDGDVRSVTAPSTSRKRSAWSQGGATPEFPGPSGIAHVRAAASSTSSRRKAWGHPGHDLLKTVHRGGGLQRRALASSSSRGRRCVSPTPENPNMRAGCLGGLGGLIFPWWMPL